VNCSLCGGAPSTTKTPSPLPRPSTGGRSGPSEKRRGNLSKVHLPDGLAGELRRWKLECKDCSPEALIFPNADGGFIDTVNYRFRVHKPLAERLGIERLNFQVLRRTMATLAQKMGSVKDLQAHLRHSRPDTTAHEYMQELPDSVQEMVGSVYSKLANGKGERKLLQPPKQLLEQMLPMSHRTKP